MKLKYNGKIEGGKLTIYHRQDFIQALENIGELECTLTLEKRTKKRSNSQNSYLWGVVYPLSRDCFKDIGYFLSLDEVHEFFKDKFLKDVVVHPDTGEMLGNTVKKSSNLNTIEFNEYFENIIRFIAETFGVEIPYPNEQTSIEF